MNNRTDKTSIMKGAAAVVAALAFVGALQAAAIKLTAPEEGAAYDTHSSCVKEFLANLEETEGGCRGAGKDLV